MATTLVGKTTYTYGDITTTADTQCYTVYPVSPSDSWGTGTQQVPCYVSTYPAQSDAEKTGKALEILKELRADGLFNIDSIEKFCDLIDRIASKL